MFPQDGLGAGAFTVLLKNTDEGEVKEVDWDVFSKVWVNMNREEE